MKFGVINSKDLFGQENPHGVISADYGLAMLALKSGASPERRVMAMRRLLDRHGLKASELFAQPDRSAALQYLANKAKIKLTITPGVVEGFSQVLDALVNSRKGELQGEIDARQQNINSLDKRFAMESAAVLVGKLLETDDPKEFAQDVDPESLDSRRREGVLAVAKCIYLWLVQDYGDYQHADNFLDELAHSVEDVMQSELDIQQTGNDVHTVRRILGEYFANKDMADVLARARNESLRVARVIVDAFVKSAPIDYEQRLQRMRYRRGESRQ